MRPGDIGVALPSARCYVLDERRRPVGAGVPGELYIGGALVARGYLGTPDLTAERFLPDPFGPGIVYRTGDVVRRMPDGRLVYLGRNDSQVQIRGHRVECGEVEQAVLHHSGVRACAVVPDGDHLVAFVVGDVAADAERALRTHMADVLPTYMVPSRVVCVSTIPLTAHGKVDAGRLLAENPPTTRRDAGPARGTSLEERIRRIWMDVLSAPEVGLHDNFFDLGGHSFALITAQERMAAQGLDISVTDLFRSGTVAGCAAHFRPRASAPKGAPAAERRAGRALLAARRRRTGGTGRGRPEQRPGCDHRDGRACARRGPRSRPVLAQHGRRRRLDQLLHTRRAARLGCVAELVDQPNFVPARGLVRGADRFDHRLFSYSPQDSALMDPQQRVLLECAWSALEHAGYPPVGQDGTGRRCSRARA